MRLPNYVKDQNRFSLAGPPQSFLQQLWEFDPSLVVICSRQGFFYRLAQRRKTGLKEAIANEAMKEQADTAMMMSYGLVPVTTILATANWYNPLLFTELHKRAPWRLGGAEKVEKDILAQEHKDWLDKRSKTGEHLDYLSKDSWKLYRKKIGLGRSWNTSPAMSKTPFRRVAQHVDRSVYFPGFGGGL